MKRFILALLLTTACMLGAPLKRPLWVASTLENLQLMNRVVNDKEAVLKMEEDRLLLLLYGDKDVVISEENGEYVRVRIKGSYVEFWANKKDYLEAIADK